MYELTGTIQGVSLDYQTGNALLTLSVDHKQSALSCYDELKTAEKLSFKIDRYREKRSLNANSYMWTLCDKLAKRLCETTRTKHTKEDIYRNAVREIGIYKDFEDLTPANAKTLCHAWEMLGTGWLTEQVDYAPDGENVVVRCYYGSSQYNKRQMSRLIDSIVQDCQAVGVETRTPDEIAKLISLWGE